MTPCRGKRTAVTVAAKTFTRSATDTFCSGRFEGARKSKSGLRDERVHTYNMQYGYELSFTQNVLQLAAKISRLRSSPDFSSQFPHEIGSGG